MLETVENIDVVYIYVHVHVRILLYVDGSEQAIKYYDVITLQRISPTPVATVTSTQGQINNKVTQKLMMATRRSTKE